MTRLSLVLAAGERHGAPMYVFGWGPDPRSPEEVARDKRRRLARQHPGDYRRYLDSNEDLEWWRDIGSKLPKLMD